MAVTFRTMKAMTILRSLAGALRGGGVQPTAELDEQVGLDHLVIEALGAPFPYQLDGDYLGESDRLEFHHVPDAVKLVMPRRMASVARTRFLGVSRWPWQARPSGPTLDLTFHCIWADGPIRLGAEGPVIETVRARIRIPPRCEAASV